MKRGQLLFVLRDYKKALTAVVLFALCSIAFACGSKEKPSERFALYLLADASATGTSVKTADLQSLQLADEPLLKASDVTSYLWNTHALTLTKAGIEKLPRSADINGTPFVIMSGGRRLYLGAFWTGLSSVSFPHPVIVMDLIAERELEVGTFVIERAYPESSFGEGPDPRETPILKVALREAKRLAEE